MLSLLSNLSLHYHHLLLLHNKFLYNSIYRLKRFIGKILMFIKGAQKKKAFKKLMVVFSL